MIRKTVLSLFIILLLILSLTSLPAKAQPQSEYPFQNPALPSEQRVENILSLMTLEEKLACLITNTAVPRLRIPNIGGAEGLHQLVVKGVPGQRDPVPTTSFALTLGMGATWDPALIRRAGEAQSYEARYAQQSDRYKKATLVNWLNVDLARDPRWGRYEESYSEDPFLTGTMATAFIRGLQGDDPKYWRAAALLKHYLANSNETTRTRSSSDFDQRLFREYYSVPFRMSIVEGGARSLMAAYNKWNGVPMLIHPSQKTVLAGEWGLDGIFSTDLGSVGNLVTQQKYLPTMEEAVAATIKAGHGQLLWFPPADGDLRKTLANAFSRKLLTETDLDAALKGKFRTAIRLGVLDPRTPYSNIGAAGEPEPWTTEKHQSIAREVARESVVLLKNAGAFLPLHKQSIKSIAVIGSRAGKVETDFYGGPTPYAVSPLQGVRDKAGAGITVNYAANNKDDAAVKAAKASDVAIVVVGNEPICGSTNPMEMFNQDGSTKPCADKGMGREGRDRESLELSEEALIRQVFAANPKTVVALVSSFPYAINWSQQNVPAILHMTHAAQEQGTALADVILGDYNPAGHLTTTWPRSLDQLPPLEDYDIRHGHTYLYFKGEPLYVFGHGLSYSTFAYSGLNLSAARLDKNRTLTVRFKIKNTSARAGAEVAQLYVEYPRSKRQRPRRELKGFQRVSLKPGEVTTVRIPLQSAALAWWDEQKNGWQVEPGPVRILVGSSSERIHFSREITVDSN
ncbi:MAG: glycoside hydrolase family 3 C-terminal domain-containing protein [Blastocatellia bacterium]